MGCILYRDINSQYVVMVGRLFDIVYWECFVPLFVIATEECPVCLTEPGKTSRTVMRCGHQICVTRFIRMSLRTDRSRGRFKCPICRITYA